MKVEDIESIICCHIGFVPSHIDMQLLKDLYILNRDLDKYKYQASKEYLDKAFFSCINQIRLNKNPLRLHE